LPPHFDAFALETLIPALTRSRRILACARARARRWRRELGGGVRQHPGSNNKGESGDEEEGSTRHGNYQASKPDADAIDAGARVSYESFARDVGYANRARFVASDKLKEHQKTGWRKLAEEVVEAMRRRADGLNRAPNRRSRGFV